MNMKEEHAKQYAYEITRTDESWGIQTPKEHLNLIVASYTKGWEECIQNLWTPVEESFPEIGETVIVLSRNGKVTTSQRYIPKDIYGNITGKETWKGSKSFADSIIAWMRIPPFTGAVEDILLNAKPMPPEFSDLIERHFHELISNE